MREEEVVGLAEVFVVCGTGTLVFVVVGLLPGTGGVFPGVGGVGTFSLVFPEGFAAT